MNIYQKMNEAMKEVDKVFKGAKVSLGGNRSYNAVKHDDVTALLRPQMVKHGIVVSASEKHREINQITVIRKDYQGGGTYEAFEYMATVTVEVSFINIDDPKDRHVVEMTAAGFDPSDKCFGKALSMAVKNAYLKNFMLESKDNEEEREFENRNVGTGGGGKPFGPSEKQIKFIRDLNSKHNVMTDEQINNIKTSQDAKAIIDKLMAKGK